MHFQLGSGIAMGSAQEQLASKREVPARRSDLWRGLPCLPIWCRLPPTAERWPWFEFLPA